MAGVVKSMDSALKSMNLEKVLDYESDYSGHGRKISLDQPQAHSSFVSCSNGWGMSLGQRYIQEISITVHGDWDVSHCRLLV